MQAGMTLEDMAMEVARQNRVKKDYTIDTSLLEFAVDVKAPEQSLDSGKTAAPIALRFTTPDGKPFEGSGHLRKSAHKQFANTLSVPSTYYDRLREEYPDLLVANLNYLLAHENKRRFLRLSLIHI